MRIQAFLTAAAINLKRLAAALALFLLVCVLTRLRRLVAVVSVADRSPARRAA
jgi:hypothetical protein